MPMRVPFDDLCCRLVGLGDPKKWQLQHRPHNPHEQFTHDKKTQLEIAEMVNRQRFHGGDRDLAHIRNDHSRRSDEYHRQEAIYHLQYLGYSSHTLRQCGLLKPHEHLVQDDPRHWNPSEVKKYFNHKENDLVRYLEQLRKPDGRRLRMSDIVDVEHQRELINEYLNHQLRARARPARIQGVRHGQRATRDHFAPRPGRSHLWSDSSNDDFLDNSSGSINIDDILDEPRRRRHERDTDFDVRPVSGHRRRRRGRDDRDIDDIFTA